MSPKQQLLLLPQQKSSDNVLEALLSLMDRMSQEAKSKGLTQEILDEILNEETNSEIKADSATASTTT